MNRNLNKIRTVTKKLFCALLTVCLLLSSINVNEIQTFAAEPENIDEPIVSGDETIQEEAPAELESEGENGDSTVSPADTPQSNENDGSMLPETSGSGSETISGSPEDSEEAAPPASEPQDNSQDALKNDSEDGEISVLTAPENQTDSESLAAKIGNVSLVNEGEEAVADQWMFDESRTLEISADFTGVTGDRILKIELPVGMVFNTGGYPTKETDPGQIELSEYQPCDMPYGYNKVPQTGTGGTLTYTIKSTVNTVNLKILISYDEQLWNKEAGGYVTGAKNEDGYAVPVKVTRQVGEETAVKVLSEVKAYKGDDAKHTYSATYNENPSLTSKKPLNKSVLVGLHYIYNGRGGADINSTPAKYWKKVILTQEAPYKLGEEKEKIYAEYADGLLISSPKGGAVSYDENTHKTTITWKNVMCSYSEPTINGCYKFSSEKFNAGDVIYYPHPEVIAQGLYGEERALYNADKYSTFTIGKGEEISIKQNTSAKKIPIKAHQRVSYQIADFLLSNTGSEDSVEKKFTYTFTGNRGVGVSSMRLIMPKKEDCILTGDGMVKVSYTVMNEKGENIPAETYSGVQYVEPSLSENSGRTVIVHRDEKMVEKNYYFREVTYNVKTLRAGTDYFTSSSPLTSGGNIYCKLTGDNVNLSNDEVCLTAELKVESAKNEDMIKDAYQKIEIKASDAEQTTTIGLTNKPLSGKETTIAAGGTLSLEATLSVSDYPYHETSYIEMPVFYFRLPKDLSLVEGSLKIKQGTGQLNAQPIRQTPIEEVDTNGNKTGYSIIPITFAEIVPIGYYSEALTMIGEELTLSYTLQASKDTNNISAYNLRDIVCVGVQDIEVSNVNSGWNPYNSDHQIKDGLNKGKNGYCATYKKDFPTVFTVQAAAPMVEFSAEVKDHSASDADYGEEMTFLGNEGVFDYRITFSNPYGGTVDGSKFYYLIQLPKKGEKLSPHLTSNSAQPDFNFSLNGPVKLKSEFSDLYEVRYSYDVPGDGAAEDFYNNGKADYSNAGGYSTYYTEEEITSRKNGWGEIRSIKLIVKENESQRVIPDGEKCTITLENVTWNVQGASENTTFNWSACGLQRYDKGEQASEGHTPTNPVTFHIHPYTIESSATLTAVKEGNNLKGTTKTVDITIPAYKESKNLKIKSVSLSEDTFNLVTSDAINNNKGNSGGDTELWGDKNFALTAKLNGGRGVDIVKKEQPIEIGSSTAGKISSLTLTLGHADIMSTNSNVGTVTVVIGDDNVIITEVITIRTIGTEMNTDDITGTIQQGKKFINITDDNSNIAITSDSSVSIQFNVKNYLHTSYAAPYIGGSLEKGTSLILTDNTNSKKPNYYFYKCKSNKETIRLSEFTSMGDENVKLDYKEIPVDAVLNFVVDYAQMEQKIIEQTSQELRLVFPGKEDGTTEKREATKMWSLTPKRKFTIIKEENSISMQSIGSVTFSGNAASQLLSGNDTYHASDYITLSIALYDAQGTTKVNFPAGASVTANNITTGTAENKGLLSLGKVGVVDTPFSIILKTTDWGLDPGNYMMKLELYCSRAEGYISSVSSTPEAETTVMLTITENPSYGLKVKLAEGSSRLINPGDSVKFQLDCKTGEGAVFSAGLYKKENGNYNNTAMFTWQESDFKKNTEGIEYEATLTIPDTVKKGTTYRIIFRMQNGDTVTEVPYNIVIKE